MVIATIVCALLVSVAAKEIAKDNAVPRVTPDLLNQLFAEKRYDEFNYYMGIDNPSLSQPRTDINYTDVPNGIPMFHEGLLEGDMMTSPKAEGRQATRFDKWPNSRWPNNPGQPSYVPIDVSNQFSQDDRNTIYNALGHANERMRCLKYVYYNGQRDYVHIFPGNGCWSYVGRTGNQQALSLGNGCVWTSTVLHEAGHAIGFVHEHNRNDRNNFVEVLWNNIPDNWKGAYHENNPNDYWDIERYDYYSVLHYPIWAPDSGGKDAFRILQNGIDRNRVGWPGQLTDMDVAKINRLYC